MNGKNKAGIAAMVERQPHLQMGLRLQKEAIVTTRDTGFKTDSPNMPAPNKLAWHSPPISKRVPARPTREQIAGQYQASIGADELI